MGHSGTDTSKERAEREASNGTATMRQKLLTIYLHNRAEKGLTWSEVADFLEVHHGSASSLLTNMHKQGRIVRLSEKRNKSKVYVLPEYTNGRDTEPYKKRVTPVECPECGHHFTLNS